ncbi:MAG: hypothetical protein LBC74_11350, partial [Planctomycetaceae bacterium]|nr:hypothetical protein [Planctomycetaceae bacterium]
MNQIIYSLDDDQIPDQLKLETKTLTGYWYKKSEHDPETYFDNYKDALRAQATHRKCSCGNIYPSRYDTCEKCYAKYLEKVRWDNGNI